MFLLSNRSLAGKDDCLVSAVLVASFYEFLNKARHDMPVSRQFDKQFDMFVDDAIRGHTKYLFTLIVERRISGGSN